MRKRHAVFLIPILLGVIAIGQAPSHFSANMLMHSQHGDMNGKMFFAGNKVRMDMKTPGGSMSSITDTAAKKNYMVMHDQQMYMENDLNKPSPMARGPRMPEVREFDPANPCANRPGITCKKVGPETVNGRACEKWEFSKDGKVSETNWIDKALRVPIKSVHEDGTSWEFQNLKEGAQPDSVFAIPAGYQKFDMGGMMRGPGRSQ